MVVQYVLHPERNPSKPQTPKRIYAQVKASSTINVKKMSREIAEISTVINFIASEYLATRWNNVKYKIQKI